MEDLTTDQTLDQKLWSILSCTENPHDLLHFVRHAQNRDASHEMALTAAKHYWVNQDSPSLMPAAAEFLLKQAEQRNPTAMFHLGRWHRLGYQTKWLEHHEKHWYEQGMKLGDGRCITYLALLLASTDKNTAVDLLKLAIDQGYAPAYCYLADHEPEHHLQHLRSAAESKDPFSMYCLGFHLMERVPESDKQQSLEWIRQAALAGDTGACLYMGLMFLYGNHGADKNLSTAFDWLTWGAKNGSAKCMGAMGRELLHRGGDESTTGQDWLFKAGMLGDEVAQGTLGFHQVWRGTTPEEQAEGIDWLRASANQDNANSIYHLGEALHRGKGVAQDDSEAAHWYAKGVKLNHSDSQAALGFLYLTGRGVPEDEAKAHDLFQLSSLQGDPWGTYMLGQTYANGYGVKQDFAAALECYAKGAEMEEPSATFRLGRAHLLGEGTPKNKGTAVRWLRKAARLGNRDAHVFLGLMLVYGDGVEENPAQAIPWFRTAAAQNDPRAYRELGYLYAAGKGVEQDMAEAQRLMAMAASLNDDEAKEWLDAHCPQKPDWLVKLRHGDVE